ncbi:MAG: Tetratricopeptide 2 repeat protein [Pedosphaera sp.]|nr:Tetratricopeptide 2 repeat protein [Pedosphaera sp.]
MLPPQAMATKQKSKFGDQLIFGLLVLAIACVAGCTPTGPGALLDGKRLVEQGKYAPAVEKLKLATSILTTNAQAWNYLGLAYHHAGQPANALDAYQRALRLNHDLIPVHYNLGCLLLEQNKLEAAKNELTAFTLHQGNSLDGWLKLGTAQIRLREFAAAEKSFNEVLRLNPQNPEALNDLGIIQMQRNHSRDAVTYFNAALKQQPDFGPALLNLAVISQANPATRASALEKYQQYLALNPRPANWDAVNTVAQQLDQELNPPVVNPPVVTRPPPPSAPVTTPNLAANPPKPASNNATRVVANTTTNYPKSESPVNPQKGTTAAMNKPPAPNMPSANLPSAVTEPVYAPEVVKLPDAPIVRPANDDLATAQTSNNAPPPPDDNIMGTPPAPAPIATTTTKKGFFQKMNPVNLFHHDPKAVAAPTPLPPVTLPRPEIGRGAAVSTNPVAMSKMAAGGTADQVSLTARYNYISPAKPVSGNRLEAERLFIQALSAQRERRYRDAVTLYRTATQADPGFFEAQSNLGLAAYEAGEMPLSLLAYETALAITPDSFNARFNFAQALKKANYMIDAAQELEKLLVINTGESPAHLATAHLMLANLYSEQFHQLQPARSHYVKVLELDPQNTQATPIRFWLRDNP